jgi:hypothetical protein
VKLINFGQGALSWRYVFDLVGCFSHIIESVLVNYTSYDVFCALVSLDVTCNSLNKFRDPCIIHAYIACMHLSLQAYAGPLTYFLLKLMKLLFNMCTARRGK